MIHKKSLKEELLYNDNNNGNRIAVTNKMLEEFKG